MELKESMHDANIIDVISAKNKLASAYRELNRDKESESILNEIIKEAYEITNQESNLFTANLENSRGMLYKKLKRFEEAERDYNRVLNTREQLLEDLHPEILSIKHNLCRN